MPVNVLNLPTEATLQSIANALTTMQGNVSGVKGQEESTYRTGQVNLTPANIGALPSSTVFVSSVNGGSGAVTGIATQQELDEVRSIAEGAGSAISFATYASMVSTFNNAADDDYKVGQSVYINTQGVPDLWVYEVSDTQILYYYTTDAAFIATLKAQGYVQVGWYKLAALESDVNLSNYMTLDGTQTVTGLKSFTDFSLINDYTNGKTLASYLSDKAGLADNNTFSGTNTFNNDITINRNKAFYVGDLQTAFIKNLDNNQIKYQSVWGHQFQGDVLPARDGTDSLGGINANTYGTKRWKDLNLAGQTNYFNSSNYKWSIGVSGGGLLQINGNDNATKYSFWNNYFSPGNNGTQDLGLDAYKWKDGYFAGQVYAENTLNVINASEMTDSTHFTEAQFNLITNGKTTKINGQIGSYKNALLIGANDQTTFVSFTIIGTDGYGQSTFGYISVNKTTYAISYSTNYRLYISNQGVYINDFKSINGKSLPAYPSSPTTNQYLTYTTGNALSWTDPVTSKADNAIISDAYDNTATYAVGDCCIYNNTLYKCNTAITTAEDFDSTKWDAITITELVSNETIVINELKQATFNVINANEIINNTLTDEQYAIITNGKPTLIKGTYLNIKNMIITYWLEYSNTWRGLAIGQCKVFSILLNTTTKQLMSGSNDLNLKNIATFNDKGVPNYPTDTAKTYSLKYVSGQLAWIED